MWLAMLALAAVVWAASSSGPRKRLLLLAEGSTPSFRSFGSRIVAFFLFLALCLALLTVLNPELRILLLFIDAVGIDVFLLLVWFQLQVGFAFVRRAWVEDLWHSLSRWGPVSFHWRALTNSVVTLLVLFVLCLHHLSRWH
jgi:hypothetical protein